MSIHFSIDLSIGNFVNRTISLTDAYKVLAFTKCKVTTTLLYALR